MRQIDTIVVHHSASPASTTLDQIRHWHTDPPPAGRGWDHIGYHAVVLADGSVWPTRLEEDAGAHAVGVNGRSLGLCLVGSFEGKCQVPTIQWQASIRITLDWMARYRVDVAHVLGHNEVPGSATLCPGFDPGAFRSALSAALEEKC